MLWRWWRRWLDLLRVQYAVYKKTLWWLVAWLGLGITLAIISILIGQPGIEDINHNLIDGNILNMTAIDVGIGNFMWQRVLSIGLPVLLAWLAAAVVRVGALLVFPLIMMHGYWLCIAVWWTFRYYALNAVFLLAFYLVWLVVVTAVLLAGLLWALQTAGRCRERHGCGNGLGWDLVRGAALIIGVAVVMGMIEYLVFWTILGRIVYKPV